MLEVTLYSAAIDVAGTQCNYRNQTLDVLYDVTDKQTCLYTHKMKISTTSTRGFIYLI